MAEWSILNFFIITIKQYFSLTSEAEGGKFTQVHISATSLPLLLVAVVTVMVAAAAAVQLGGYNYDIIMCLLP